MIAHFKNVLVLAPHTDDGELGAGGTIARLVEEGASVHYFAFSTAEKSVPEGFAPDVLKAEVKCATQYLGIPESNLYVFDYEVRKLDLARQQILETLISQREIIKPDLILLPSLNDIHQDHAVIAREGLRAFKYTSILGYELIWNNLTFDTTAFVKLERRHVDKKIEALSAYKSQHGKEYMAPDFIAALARTRGVQIGCEHAESFEVLRWMIT